ncbi:hypothetical protein Plim_0371 [Planctopirus limnophila DSM 3776]|uniref:Uncharacterized protein n=1 Tax=Planctopirus limnophila (strain ATCC 43296 / DSM 3776 / IFAM 1008 / Mu 290) TaxID=521674 RepID=D5SPJ2_PLAL2|nr:hypothetical protein Plim_0371 [Planctopirus limnophila DSM 3776]
MASNMARRLLRASDSRLLSRDLPHLPLNEVGQTRLYRKIEERFNSFQQSILRSEIMHRSDETTSETATRTTRTV